MAPFFLYELLRSEIETSQQGQLIGELAQHGISLPQMIDLFEEKTLTPVYAHIDSLGKLPPNQLAEDFMKAKRAILDSLSWMKLCNETYRNQLPDSLNPAALTHLDKMVEKLQSQMALIDRFIPQVIAFRKENLPNDYRKTAQLALDSIEQILRAELNSDEKEVPIEKAEAHAKVQHVLQTFLAQQKTIFQEIAEDANSQQSLWEREVVSNGRGIYISASDRCPFPLIYSVKGNLYVIMEVVSHYIAKGTEKFVSRTANLKTGQIDALVKPREFFTEVKSPEEETMHKESAFWDTWRDADKLMYFQNKQGILQVRDRLVFQTGEKKVLYLFEEYCRGKTIEWLFWVGKEELRKLTFADKHQLAHDILFGLKQVHDAQIIHHDIKPNNILLHKTPQGNLSAVLSDFHLSCYTNDKLMKEIARVVPAWAAPEYARIMKNEDSPLEAFYAAATQKLDVWAVGLILFMLFNEVSLPWLGLEDNPQVLDAVSSLQPGWVPRFSGDERYFPLLEKMLEIDPAKRISSAEALDRLNQIVL
ncbi:MAG: protein kinase [Verrucomicrobia bacterium]|nr:protein kinase [Verrucomicrobiota bacterium]